jgi:quinoprotein glucose dehydrogenase
MKPTGIQFSSCRKTSGKSEAAQPVLANPPMLLIIGSMLCPDIVHKLTSRFAFGLFLLAGALNCPAQRSTNNPSGAAELGMKKFQLAPGLKIDLFAAEPMLQNPVSFSIDEKGRVFVAETHRYGISILDITQNTPWLTNDLSFRTVGDRSRFLIKTFATNEGILTKDSEIIRLVEDRAGSGHADSSIVFADGFNQIPSGVAAGVLARHGEVWAACIPDLWHLQAPAGSDQSPAREKLHTGFGVHIGVTGHDLHGLRLGPDGRLYMSSGDRGFSVTTKEGRLLDYPDTGAVLRCNPDGSDLEVFATGLRNPQELAFDQYGNLFTDDNDTAGEDRSRVIYVVEGADYGWRCSYQHMSGFGPWNKEKVWMGNIDDALPGCGYVSQGPSGLAYYPGTGLPDKYKNHFLVCDFPGGVRSFAVKPKGASFETVENEKFLWNLWPTDVDFGPDGCVYVSDWVEGWKMPDKGRLYRIYDPLQTSNAVVAGVKQLLGEGMDKRPVGELVGLLSHADMRVRLEAQYALAGQGLVGSAALREVALNSKAPQLARLHALWGIGQVAAVRQKQEPQTADDSNHELTDAQLDPLLPLLADKDSEIRAQTAKLMGEQRATKAYGGLARLLNDGNPRVEFFAAVSIGKLNNKQAIAPIKSFLRRNDGKDAYLTHAGIMALLELGDLDAILSAGHDKSPAVRRAAMLCLRRLENPLISSFLKDADPGIAVEAARAINDVPITNAFPELAAMLGPKHRALWRDDLVNQEWNDDTKVGKSIKSETGWRHVLPYEQLVLRAINANYRLGKSENAMAVADFVGRVDSPEGMRFAALEALADWARPQPIDRLVGLWRPLPKRDAAVAGAALHPYLGQLLRTSDEKMLVATVRCAVKLDMTEIIPVIGEFYEKAQLTSATRIELLQALADLKDNRLDKDVALALADSNKGLRRQGVKLLSRLDSTNAVELLEPLIATEKDVRLGQSAYAALGQMKVPAADTVIVHSLDQLTADKIRPELQLDLLEAAAKRTNHDVKTALLHYADTRPKNDEFTGYREVLMGGDLNSGRKIFIERAGVECTRCHALNGKGGVVGPELAGIGKKQSREYLLESILYPSKKIAPGFENITLVMKDGTTHAGIVKNENDKELVLNSPEDGLLHVSKDLIESRQPGASAMPEGMAKLLSKQDLRDLVEFLASLK